MLIVFIAVHLFGVHSKLLFQLNPDKVKTISGNIMVFSFNDITENNITAIIFALSYSIATAVILTLSYDKKYMLYIITLVFGLLDGAGVFIYYNVKLENFVIWGSVYYAIYTFVIIISAGYYRLKNEPDLSKKTDESQLTELIKTAKPRNRFENRNEYSDEEKKKLELKVLELNEQGRKQVDIAKELNCSQPLVSKILKKYQSN